MIVICTVAKPLISFYILKANRLERQMCNQSQNQIENSEKKE